MAPKIPVALWVNEEKYLEKGETQKQKARRVAEALSDNPSHADAFYEIFMDDRFLPGGRIQVAAGSYRHTTAFNCFVMQTIPDSIDGIFDVLQEAALTMQKGGGVGYDFSTIRPKGSRVVSLGSFASGPLSFMEVFDSMCKTIMSAGSRRGAMMGCMRVDHPDIIEFITAKTNENKLQNFNVSVLVTDEFMEAVKSDSDFNLVFNGKVHDTVRARKLWDTILQNTWDWAEPGVIFIDRINDMNNLWYCEDIAATNPCKQHCMA
tara:strand:+ start:3290 stop:4078 length:789 start_codon:yes stop_codon:yes gene_type:complete